MGNHKNINQMKNEVVLQNQLKNGMPITSLGNSTLAAIGNNTVFAGA